MKSNILNTQMQKLLVRVNAYYLKLAMLKTKIEESAKKNVQIIYDVDGNKVVLINDIRFIYW